MGLSDGAFFMIIHTLLPNKNHLILSSICPMGVANTLEPNKLDMRVQIDWPYGTRTDDIRYDLNQSYSYSPYSRYITQVKTFDIIGVWYSKLYHPYK